MDNTPATDANADAAVSDETTETGTDAARNRFSSKSVNALRERTNTAISPNPRSLPSSFLLSV